MEHINHTHAPRRVAQRTTGVKVVTRRSSRACSLRSCPHQRAKAEQAEMVIPAGVEPAFAA